MCANTGLREDGRLTGERRFDLAGFSLSPALGYAALAVLGILSLAVVYVFDPRNPGIYPVCPFFGLTGYHCPGCGTLRALHQLLNGNIGGAFGYNAYTMLAMPFIGYSYATGALRVFRLPAPAPVFLPHQLIWALLVAIVVFWVLRNVPAGPFVVLTP